MISRIGTRDGDLDRWIKTQKFGEGERGEGVVSEARWKVWMRMDYGMDGMDGMYV